MEYSGLKIDSTTDNGHLRYTSSSYISSVVRLGLPSDFRSFKRTEKAERV